MTIPILILGDAPNLPTGLGRIARDLATHLHADSALDVEVGQLGWGYDGSPFPWRVYPVYDSDAWAVDDLEKVWNWHARGRKGVLLTVWDPSRCYPTSKITLPGMKRWGYFAVDATNTNGVFGGPGAEALTTYDRVLAYGQWGAGVLKKTINAKLLELAPGAEDVTVRFDVNTVQWLPHGIDLDVFKPGGGPAREHVVNAIMRWLGTAATVTVGCVASNQPRKDLGSLFRCLQDYDGVKLWLHTDVAIKAWSIPELQDIYGPVGDRLLVSGAGADEKDKSGELTDHELALLYSLCDVTIAPGLGEGFGYPIVESMACGTPVVAVAYGGGVELIPDGRNLWEPSGYRVEGIYALERPVLGELSLPLTSRGVLAGPPEYWRGAVAHLDWDVLWGRWRSWFKQGLEELS